MKFTRLLDALDYQENKFGLLDTVMASKKNGVWTHFSTSTVKQQINDIATGLIKLGISGNNFTVEDADKVAIISNNRPEWVITDIAVQQTGAILVPLYPTTNSAEIQFILNDAAVKCIFVSSQELYEKISAIKPFIPSLQHIYSFEHLNGCPHYSSLFNISTNVEQVQLNEIKQNISSNHVATIIYTSGTTGTPKGVMLTHKNLCTCINNGKEFFPFEDNSSRRALSFLPLNHIFEKAITYIYLSTGTNIYYAESMDTIGENIKEVKPHGFSCVPRLLEKVYERIMAKGSDLKGIKRQLFNWAIKLGLQYDNRQNLGLWYNMQMAVANRIIFSKWREALGNNVDFVITGGAACPMHLMRIFNAAKVPIYEGYGPTENSPVISINCRFKGGQKYGSVGLPLKGIEVKLAEDGEIMVKGDTVMKGYYKRPDLTAETIVDGWLLTGDIGTWDEGFLKITDRKKELFKTSGGKYVAPQPLENKYKESPYIEQILVIGADKKFVAALIVPSFNKLKEWCDEQKITFTSNEEMIKNPKVIALFQSIADGYNPMFNHVEQIKKFELLPAEWTIEKGEMTPKLSLKRKVIEQNYANSINVIYA